MSAKLSLPGRHQVILTLPPAEIDDLLPAGEVLAQEGFLTWALAADAVAELPTLVKTFGRRVLIGVSGIDDPVQVAEVAAAGAGFVASDFLLPELVAAASELPVVLGGLTPSELRAGLAAGAAAVQVTPAGVYRGELQLLPAMLGFAPLVASGTLNPDRARDWLDAGAVAVWPHGLVGTELVTGATLGALRTTLRDWRLND